MDRISKLPVGIIETILCMLPIQDAARTSILSREWRYHWINIHKLAFIEDTFQMINKPRRRIKRAKRRKLFSAINQVLFIHQGPIHEFTLSVEVDDNPYLEIDHILLLLSKKNTLKILKLHYIGIFERCELPTSLFSLHQLTDLHLHRCAIFHERPFNELGCLTTLYIGRIYTYLKTLVRFLSSCPVLKRLTLAVDGTTLFGTQNTPIADLFKCLPVIEYLSLSFFMVLCFLLPERLPKVLLTALSHLKYLYINYMCFRHIYGLPFLALLIRSSPNLEKLKLEVYEEYWLEEDETTSFILEDYSDIMLEHLNELEIQRFRNTVNELDFLKFILAKSPVLKKVSIFPCQEFHEDEASQISKVFLCSPCASPVVKIIVIPDR